MRDTACTRPLHRRPAGPVRRPAHRRDPGKALGTAACLAGALLCLLAPRSVRAQAVEVGLRAGVNRATVAWDASPLGSGFEELRRRTTFTGGGSLSVPIPLGLRLRAEMLWTGKGLREVQSDATEARLELSYLELPLLLARRLETEAGVSPELYAGPYLAREVSCRLRGVLPEGDQTFGCDQAPGGPVERRTTEWGAVAGGSLLVGNADRLRAVLDVRYVLGLRNVDAAPRVDNLNTRHRGLGFTAGITVPLGAR